MGMKNRSEVDRWVFRGGSVVGGSVVGGSGRSLLGRLVDRTFGTM